MSAIWGHIEFNKETCAIKTMSSEYKRKCKLDAIAEVNIVNALLGSGLQIINTEDNYEAMPYVVDKNGDILPTKNNDTNDAQNTGINANIDHSIISDCPPQETRTISTSEYSSLDVKTIITADCILDNRDDLIAELCSNGHNSKREIPNGELICLAYKKWGYDLVRHLAGIYSVAIYDLEKKELFLFTDRTSSRCLYYYKDEHSVTFSTLISPIKQLYPDIPRNEMYLKDFLLIPGLMPNVSSKETPWENIFIIEAGCSVTITESGAEQNRYWSPEDLHLSRDINKLKEQFLETYNKAVERAVRTDKNVGIALSSGFDSASVAVLAAPKLSKRGKNLISYTYVPHFNMQQYYPKRVITNESAYVKEIAKMYPNIETNFTDNDGKSFWGYVEELLDVMEIPFKAFVNLPLLLEIYRSASERGCKVFLNGQTGNASVSFGKIEETLFDLYRRKKYVSVFRYLNNYCKAAHISRAKAFPKILSNLPKQKHVSTIQQEVPENLINKYVNPSLMKDYSLNQRNRSGMILDFEDHYIRRREVLSNIVYTLPALSYIGAMETKLGLYTGIVIRDATRDMDILNFCNSFPFDYYSYEGIPRYLIRGFMQDYLPMCILYPILKKGRQSTDWIFRLKDSKEEIIDSVKELSTNDHYKKYVNSASITDFINSKADFNLENENNYLNLFIAYVFMNYIRNS